METKMNKRVIFECVKAFVIGAIIGLTVMYFAKTDSFKTPIVFGIIAISIHTRKNVYLKKD
jgi:hypothetical protein